MTNTTDREIKFRAWKTIYRNKYDIDLKRFREKLYEDGKRFGCSRYSYNKITLEKFEKERKVKYAEGIYKEKEMTYSPHIYGDETFGQESMVDINSGLKDKEQIFLQYTGLKDENGKEIYEGDILRYKPYCNLEYNDVEAIGEVVWGETGDSDDYGHSKHLEWIVGSDSLADIADGNWQGFECEVIGNIYENPELIKSKNND